MNIFETTEECDKARNKLIFKTRKEFVDHYKVITSEKQFNILLDSWKKPHNLYYPCWNKWNRSYGKEVLSKINNKIYQNDKQSIINTFKYIFYNHFSGIYVSIRDSKVKFFRLFENEKYINQYSEELKNKSYINVREPETWKIIQCVARKYDYSKSDQHYVVDYYHEMEVLFNLLCEKSLVSDIDFFINYRDQNILKKDLTDPFHHITDSKNSKLKQHKYTSYAPIFSFCTQDNYLDIPIITPNDISRISGGYIIGACNTNFETDINRDWKTKKNIAIFRGSSTGCGYDIESNPRLKISYLNQKWKKQNKKLIDAGIVRLNTRAIKKVSNKKFGKSKKNLVPELYFMSMKEQSNYKYTICIEGYVSAYRLGYLFSTNSVVIYIKSDYKPWFYHLLDHKYNCIMVKNDLSDLEEKIKWLQKNDKQSELIAMRGLELYMDHLITMPIIRYMNLVLNLTSYNKTNKET